MAFLKDILKRSWPTTLLAAVAIDLTLLQAHQQQLESNYAELVSCALAWGLAYGLLRVGQSPAAKRASDESHEGWKYWAVAGVVAATEWLGGDMSWLWPLVTALLVLLHRVWERSGGANVSKEGLLTTSVASSSTAYFANPLRRTLEAVAIAVFSLVCFVAESDDLQLPSLGAGVASATAWAAVFAALHMLSASRDDPTAEQSSNGVAVLGMKLAWRVAVLLGGLCVLYPIFLPPQQLHWSVAVRAAIAAGQWMLFFSMASTTPWATVTSILAFSTAGLEANDGPLSYIAQGLACILAVYQTISFVPRSQRYREVLWIFLGVPLVLFTLALRLSYFPPEEVLPAGLHPIEALAYRADIRFNRMLQSQSRTFEAASKEYTRRYKRSPPPGFQHWFEYAMEHNSPIIDDFDSIDEGIRPFFGMSGEEVLSTMQIVQEADRANIGVCKIQHGQWVEPCMEGAMRSLLNSFQAHIPDVKLFLNGFDEPRLLSTAAPNDTEQWTETTHRNVWEDLNGPCNLPRNRHMPSRQRPIETHGIPFIQDTFDAIDICEHPENENLHGLWLAPATWVVSPATVPILSPGRPSTMGDLLFPAQAYTQDRYMYDPTKDMPFDNKTPGLYWVGSTTGNHVTNDTSQEVWQQFHRQRFVAFVNRLGLDGDRHDSYLFHNDTTDSWERLEEIDGLTTEHYYHVRFSNLVQCDVLACEAQRKYFKDVFTDWAPVEESLSYTLTMDLDGNGHSGRYYQLLGSRSLPLKQTVLKEWHDDRLVAWAHYVPITLGLEELPEVVRFFVEDDRGRQLAEELAEKGRLWHARALRPVDMAVYMYRLILEVARLQDVGRMGETY